MIWRYFVFLKQTSKPYIAWGRRYPCLRNSMYNSYRYFGVNTMRERFLFFFSCCYILCLHNANIKDKWDKGTWLVTQITWHIYADWDPHLQNPRRNFWRLLLALNILIPVYASLYLLIEQSFSPLQRYLGLLFHLLVCDLSFHFISLVLVFAILSTFVDFFPHHRITEL